MKATLCADCATPLGNRWDQKRGICEACYWQRPAVAIAKDGARYRWVLWESGTARVEGADAIADGWAVNEFAARDDAYAAAGQPVSLVPAGAVRQWVRANAARRRMERGTTATEAAPLELLYADTFTLADDNRFEYGWLPHRVVKKTARFVYVDRRPYDPGRRLSGDWRDYARQTHRLDRAELERTGKARGGKWLTFHATPERSTAAGIPCLDVLGLSLPCDPADIHRAYRRLARTTHPDAGGEHDAFLALQTAYEQALALVGRSAA